MGEVYLADRHRQTQTDTDRHRQTQTVGVQSDIIPMLYVILYLLGYQSNLVFRKKICLYILELHQRDANISDSTFKQITTDASFNKKFVCLFRQ